MALRHEPNFTDPGEPLGAYAVCLFKDGQTDFEFMSLKQIEAIRGRSKAGDSGPWKTDWSEMARKTAIRRLSKRLPVDSDMSRVVERIDEDYDGLKPDGGGEPTHDADGVVIENAAEKPAGKAKGAAAAKLNPKPKEPEPEAVEAEPVENEPPAVADQAGDDADFDDLI